MLQLNENLDLMVLKYKTIKNISKFVLVLQTNICMTNTNIAVELQNYNQFIEPLIHMDTYSISV